MRKKSMSRRMPKVAARRLRPLAKIYKQSLQSVGSKPLMVSLGTALTLAALSGLFVVFKMKKD